MAYFDKELQDEIQLVSAKELPPIAGHVGVNYRNCLLVWGGYYYDQEGQYYRNPAFLYIYPYKLFGQSIVFIKVKLRGEIPRPTTAASGCVFGNTMYIFGGNVERETEDGDDFSRTVMTTSRLYALNISKGEWKLMDTSGQKLPTPRDKAAGFACEKGCYFFGGYGLSHRRVKRPENYLYTIHDYFEDEDLSCWNNQMLHYDGTKWHLIKQTGDVPCHRAAAAISYNPKTKKAYLFGGRHAAFRLDDLYEYDVKTSHWRSISFRNAFCKPLGRSWASLTYNAEDNYFLLYGGISAQDRALNDIYKIKLIDSKFCEAESIDVEALKNGPSKRLWHCTVYINGTFVAYGGMNNMPASLIPPCTSTMDFLNFSPPSLQSLAIRKVAKVYGNNLNVGSFPYLLQAKLIMLLFKQNFLESIKDVPVSHTEYVTSFPLELSNAKRRLPNNLTPQVLFNALDF